MKKNRPPLGVKDGKWAEGPKTMNYVSTQTDDLNRQMLPISYDLPLEDAVDLLIEVLEAMPKTSIITREKQYVHAEWMTQALEFINDAEFYFNEDIKEVHFRSVSRIGLADFGANKRWLQSIFARFLKRASQQQK